MTTEYAYTMGYDCGFNGASATNSHYRLFATPQLLKAWERGKEAGDADRQENQKESNKNTYHQHKK